MSQPSGKGSCYSGGTPSFIIRLLPGKKSCNWQGELIHARSGETRAFKSYLEMVILIQDWLVLEGVPVPETELRSWESAVLSDHLPGDN